MTTDSALYAGQYPRTNVQRRGGRATHDRDAVYAVLDEALVAHVSYVADDGSPRIIPFAFVRVKHEIILHGARACAALTAIAKGAAACIAVTILDGLVLALSAFKHSMNYRSVVVFGAARVIDDPFEKIATGNALIDRLEAGRSGLVRPPTQAELDATLMVGVSCDEIVKKERRGPPVGDARDAEIRAREGVIPVLSLWGEFCSGGSR